MVRLWKIVGHINYSLDYNKNYPNYTRVRMNECESREEVPNLRSEFVTNLNPYQKKNKQTRMSVTRSMLHDPCLISSHRKSRPFLEKMIKKL